MGKLLGTVTDDDVKGLVEECRKVAAGLRSMPAKHAHAAIDGAFQEALNTIKLIEGRIAEAGCIPGDITGVFMVYGAVVAILEDLPAEDDRRQLVNAGRELGKFIAAKFGEKIRNHLTQETN